MTKKIPRNEKKITAAMAAVAIYLQQEQQAAYEAAAVDMPLTQQPRFDLNLWGLSGRQSIMQQRSLMQLKALGR